jgi:hypothetical protein
MTFLHVLVLAGERGSVRGEQSALLLQPAHEGRRGATQCGRRAVGGSAWSPGRREAARARTSEDERGRASLSLPPAARSTARGARACPRDGQAALFALFAMTAVLCRRSLARPLPLILSGHRLLPRAGHRAPRPQGGNSSGVTGKGIAQTDTPVESLLTTL